MSNKDTVFYKKNKAYFLNSNALNLSSDGGVLIVEHIEKQYGIIKTISNTFVDNRNQNYVTHNYYDMFKQRVYRILLDYEDGDDIEMIPQDVYEIETFIDGSIMTISDAPWPGLSPDLLSIMLVVASQAKGTILIHQKMFESRLFFVDKLIDMGAQIILCDPHRANVIGLNRQNSLAEQI